MNLKSTTIPALLFLLVPLSIPAQTPSLPDAPGRDALQRVCSACHPATLVAESGMTREGWDQVIATMIGRGAKGSPADFKLIADYLTTNFPAHPTSGKVSASTTKHTARPRSGPGDQPDVDPVAVSRGQSFYKTSCQSCHGALARGNARGPDLVRSQVVLHDRYGNQLGPYLLQKHPKANPDFTTELSQTTILDLSNFLRQQINDTLRSGPYTKVLNVVTGDADQGRSFFQDKGGCTSCHSVSGDLSGIATRYPAPVLQQRLLFPRSPVLSGPAPKPVQSQTVQVSAPGQPAVSGTLVYVDDFNVSLHDSSGQYHTWARTPELSVKTTDPYAGHDALLDIYTDRDIHNLVAYLETLK